LAGNSLFRFSDPEVAKYILYPKKKEDYPSPDKEDWHIVFADDSMLQTLAEFGQNICGLDSCFKFTKYSFIPKNIIY
jgi:hypothetical protein